MDEFRKNFWALVNRAKKVVITTHVSPDDDAIGSVLALKQIIEQKSPNKKVRLIVTGEPFDRFHSFQYFDQVEFVNDLADEVATADLLICLDGGQYYRFSNQTAKLQANYTGPTICIDHHRSTPDNFTLTLLLPEEPATAVIIYKLFADQINLTKPLAETLLLGLLGDTGNFSYLKPEQGEILDIAKKLLRAANTSIGTFQERYRLVSPRVFKLIQQLLANTTYHPAGQTSSATWDAWQSSHLPRSVIDEEGYTDNEISSASHIYMGQYLRTIKGYPWGVVVSPDSNGECSISVRSLPDSINAREIMERTGLGGGHDRAAGGTFKTTGNTSRQPKECLRWLETWLVKNKPA